jgi:DtxR family transcriptional regulator, Mn-dependent transcriptional regulator
MLPLSPRQEDYLEAILALDGGAGARPTDLARRLKVRAPSVTAGLRTLAAKGVVRHARYGAVTLTPRGRLAARAVTARHEALRHFLQRVLTVSARDAEAAACRMEHALPARVLRKIVSFLDFVDHCPHGGGGYIDSFRRHCSRTPVGPACVSCDQPARHARRAAAARRTS